MLKMDSTLECLINYILMKGVTLQKRMRKDARNIYLKANIIGKYDFLSSFNLPRSI